MGFRISWLAARGIGRERLLASLNLVDTGEPDEANEAPFSIADLPTGWSVLWSNDEAYADEALASALSRSDGPVLAVRVNETCMHSTAALFEHGQRRWRVHHEGDETIDFLEIDGEAPAEARAIEEEARSLQAEEDVGGAEVDYMFDVPLEIARHVCGFKHDLGGFDWGEPMFTAVTPQGSTASDQKGKGLVRWLLGRS